MYSNTRYKLKVRLERVEREKVGWEEEVVRTIKQSI